MAFRNSFAAPLLPVLGIALALWGGALAAAEEGGHRDAPVKTVGAPLVTVGTAAGTGILPGFISRDWTAPQPDITRVVLIFHGQLRNAAVYWRSAQKALAASGDEAHTMMIVPQFLADVDVRKHELPETYLHWNVVNWEGGDEANGPIPASSFEALDAILDRLADHGLFPNLKTVVLAGHSGGGQVVQHYAIVGKAEDALTKAGIHVRYVVANPSTYLYFTPERPVQPAQVCPAYDRWKYGWTDAPAYARAKSRGDYEAEYAKRDVVYLLGANDTNPNQAALDKSCAAETQGPYRLARGHFYFSYLQKRNPAMTSQRIIEVEGVGHDGDGMFTSPAGLQVLFDK